MKIHPQPSQLNGIITLVLTAQFIGDLTDANDQALIQAYGDPLVDLAGQFTNGQPVSPFVFNTTVPTLSVGLTTMMQSKTIRFMTQLPAAPANVSRHAGVGSNPWEPQPLDIITPNPSMAAGIYAAAIQARIQAVMAALRAKTAPIVTLPDTTV